MTFLVDSHCHLASLSLQGKAGADLKSILVRAQKTGVTHMLCVACTPQEHVKMLKKVGDYPWIYTACGVHPLNLDEAPDWTEDELEEALKADSTVALGETGLDYHYAPQTRKSQLDSFARQIALSRKLNLPLIVHARQAHEDTVALLRSEQARDCGGVMHCFCDEVAMARQCLDLGFYISFSGILTFKAGENVRKVARYVPVDRMLVETDCPYLAPVPVRGVENEPAFVRYTAEFLASLKGLSLKSVCEITSRNFEELFKVKLTDHPFIEDDGTTQWKIEKILSPIGCSDNSFS